MCIERDTCITCTKKHPTCLHDENFVYKRQNGGRGNGSKQDASQSGSSPTPVVNSQRPVPASTTVVTSHRAHESGSNGLTAMIVPVYLSSDDDPGNEVLTYALLDTMSNATFVVQSLAEDINAK